MSKVCKTAFELEAMIAAEMLLLGECPIGIPLFVRPEGAGWTAVVRTSDANCIANVAQIEAKLRAEYDLEP
jgi:hypothetical protein